MQMQTTLLDKNLLQEKNNSYGILNENLPQDVDDAYE